MGPGPALLDEAVDELPQLGQGAVQPEVGGRRQPHGQGDEVAEAGRQQVEDLAQGDRVGLAVPGRIQVEQRLEGDGAGERGICSAQQ